MISDLECKNISGGMSESLIAGIVGGAIAIIIGIIKGYTNPVVCNK